ncbi:MAG: hypothetical protein PVG73_10530 [Desulfobacterales bacterium]
MAEGKGAWGAGQKTYVGHILILDPPSSGIYKINNAIYEPVDLVCFLDFVKNNNQ